MEKITQDKLNEFIRHDLHEIAEKRMHREYYYIVLEDEKIRVKGRKFFNDEFDESNYKNGNFFKKPQLAIIVMTKFIEKYGFIGPKPINRAERRYN